MSDHLKTMLTVDEALDLILAAFMPLGTETIPLNDGFGRILAQDIRAANDLPPFANSSMDGYAVRAADLANLPITLPVVDDIPAGSAPRITVEPGQAARIMTGAPMPAGADAVVPVEQTNDNSRLAATAPV